MHRQRLFKFILLSSLSHVLTTQAQATNDTQLPNMVVTATRSEQDTSELAAGATVYTRKDIERLQVNTLPDLLKNSIGIDMVQAGGYGKTTSLFMRGTNSSHLLVLIDGIKVGSASLGQTAFEFIPIDQIERVEIIRGPLSSLYGSEAIGGVIQIFTRKGSGASQQPTVVVNTGGGSYDTAKASASVSGNVNNSWYAFSASHLTSQGFNSRQPIVDWSGKLASEPDRDGYENTSGNAKIGHRFANNAEIEAFFMRSEGTTNYDGNPNKTNFAEQVVGITGNMQIMSDWKATLRLGQSLDNNTQFMPDGSFFSRFNTSRWNATWLNHFNLNDNHQLIIGSDYRLDEIDSDTRYIKNSRYDFGGFAELHSRVFDKHFLTASLRGDGNEAFGNYVTGSIGWRYHAPLGLSPFASFGNAFKSPTFNDLYWPGANPLLKPEESQSVEAGITGEHSWGRWEVRAYHTTIDNLIAWNPSPTATNPWRWLPDNVNKAQIDGLETEIGTQFYDYNVKLNLNLLNPHDVSHQTRLMNRADKLLSFDVSKSIQQFDLGTTVLAQGERFNGVNNTAGFVTIDLRAAYHVNKNWLLSAKLSNLLDQNYQTISTYNSAGRNFFISVQYTH
ncbi:MAG: TonB-dependent receptor [Methylococcaceae bacterium]